MCPIVEGAGVALAYEAAGEGPTVLLVHDMAAGAATWAPETERLVAGGARAIAYDRRGYGDSGAPQPYDATTVQEQAEDAAALLRELDAAPAIVAGEGFGALVALDLLRRHAGQVRGAVLADAPVLAFVPEATEELAAQRAELEAALREGGPAEAVTRWLGSRAADPGALALAQASPRAFFADYGGLASLPVTRVDLRAITAPVVVLTGPETKPAVRMAADRVAEYLPAARRQDDGDIVAAVLALL